ncbi:hypothetical protein [Vibrio aestuarianus]|uniref:Uncharacterized protein n=1 Tax=Vibrio aestuarianus TaxID=28171 RepID=A0A9X4IRF4_9VIBR|nr:hypothetical protein [Vibrio aestuarianus]MDE1244031.1 hypothetical protein [Vibrio aestuarianus]
MAQFIVLGSWKIRHDEYPSDAEKALYFLSLPEEYNLAHRTVLCDVSAIEAPILDSDFVPVSNQVEKANLSERTVPLALVSLDGSAATITHLVHRVEVFTTQFYQLPALPFDVNKVTLFDALSSLFKEHHLLSNNFECYYEKGIPDTELEQKFSIQDNYNFYELNERFYAALANGEIADFKPHLGDEIEHWSYDNDFCEIAENDQGISGYVSVMHWSRKKKIRFDEPVLTFKKKLYKEDALERWERNYHFQTVKTTPEAALTEFFNLPLVTLPSWRRVRLDIACEYTPTGDIYMLNFEDCRIKDVYEPQGRLQQCEIEYLKTRGHADEANIYKGFNALVSVVEDFIDTQGLRFEKNHYSKLTFLKDYIKHNAEKQ